MSDEFEPTLEDRLEMLAAGDNTNIMPRQRQLDGQVTPDDPGTVHADFQSFHGKRALGWGDYSTCSGRVRL